MHPPSSSTVCLFFLSATACLLFLRRSPKRIADEAELVSGFASVLPAFVVDPPPDFFVGDDGDEEDAKKEMSGFSVEGEGGCLVEDEKEWAKESG